MNKRTHVVLSDQLLKEIDALVGRRQRSGFLTQAAERELMRRRQVAALKAAAGAWKDKDHPETIPSKKFATPMPGSWGRTSQARDFMKLC